MDSPSLTSVVFLLSITDICFSLQPSQQINFADTPREVNECFCTTSDGNVGICRSSSRCTNIIDKFPLAKCHLGGQFNSGICCPIVSTPDPDVGFRVTPPVISLIPLVVSADLLNEVIACGECALQDKDKLELKLFELGSFAQLGSPEFGHAFNQFAEDSSVELARDAFILRKAAAVLVQRLNLTAATAATSIKTVSINGTSLARSCPVDPVCPNAIYRSIDGSCNNLAHPNWGKSGRAVNRLLPPKYKDGIEQPRAASDGSELPSTRLISAAALPDANRELTHVTVLFMTWGQFLDHDLIQNPLNRGANNTALDCCKPEALLDATKQHVECLPITVPPNDSFYSKVPATKNMCMSFARSLDARSQDCTLSHREQLNQLTAYIDASQIYGSTESVGQKLRENVGGRLKAVQLKDGREMPPLQTTETPCKSRPTTEEFCFEAGDTRSSVQPLLTTLHVIWLREHNRVAAELAKINPVWDDEKLYQESRRIVIAEVQHITYNEFLRIVLGGSIMEQFKLNPSQFGFTTDYDREVDATILNEFSTAAYRFGHSSIPGFFNLQNGNIQELKDRFLQPYDTKLVGSYINGAVNQSSQNIDNLFTSHVTTMLFRNVARNENFGLDLPALNMQRGRDHGIPGYNEIRELCGLKRASSFREFEGLLNNGNVARTLSRLYKNVDDVDLFVAGVSEKHFSGAVVGETFACIISEQFRRLKMGDRFWYERGDAETSFTKAQLSEIHKSSLARVFCDNSDIEKIQPLVLLKSTDWNNRVDCDSNSIPKLNLKPWEIGFDDASGRQCNCI